MARRRGKKRPKGSQQGVAPSPLQEEMIVQAYAVSGNKSEVARNMRMTVPTITKVLRKADSDIHLQKIRSHALEEIRGKVHGKAVEIIDSISPEDIESGLIKVHDDSGELVSVKSYGPSLMQKVTSAAILTDKLKVITETRQAMEQDRESDPASLPLPGDIESALQAIGEKVKRLRVLDVQFHDKNPELAERVQDAAHRASLNQEIEEASYEELDFDG